MKKYIPVFVVLTIVTIVLSSCNLTSLKKAAEVGVPVVEAAAEKPAQLELKLPTATAVVSAVLPTSTATLPPAPTSTSTQVNLGPVEFPQGFNPLTGLSVPDPSNLSLIPALVSVSTFPESARPEVGLSFASWVFEGYIGEGMTRYLAIYYGLLPSLASSDNSGDVAAAIGPVRSGRLWYEDARRLFSGFIVMASGSANVVSQLSGYTSIFGSDEGNINSALLPVDQLKLIAAKNKSRLVSGALAGNEFSAAIPDGGKIGESVWVRWSLLDQVFWKFDPTSGAYNRYQNGTTEETSQQFTKSTDRINKEPLTFENVVILFANYQITKKTNIGIELLDVTRPALLFRDGQVYSIRWTTTNDSFSQKTGVRRPIRFIDANGNPFPMEPGQTWIEIVPMYTPYYETVETWDILKMLRTETPGSGHWAVVFYPPASTK